MDNNQPSKYTQPEPVKFLVFSASLRKDSLNTKLAQLAALEIEKNGGIADFASMSEFDAPSYNQDLEINGYMPEGASEFCRRLQSNDAFIISSPEYNASMPGYLKNAIDWVSRFRPQPFKERHALIMSASPSMVGGNRGLWSLRIPFEHLGANVYPEMFSFSMAHKAFDENGKIADEVLAKRFGVTVLAFMNLVEAAKNYPCMKNSWVEFPGEKPDPIIDRVE